MRTASYLEHLDFFSQRKAATNYDHLEVELGEYSQRRTWRNSHPEKAQLERTLLQKELYGENDSREELRQMLAQDAKIQRIAERDQERGVESFDDDDLEEVDESAVSAQPTAEDIATA
jgi:hypothetical protein